MVLGLANSGQKEGQRHLMDGSFKAVGMDMSHPFAWPFTYEFCKDQVEFTPYRTESIFTYVARQKAALNDLFCRSLANPCSDGTGAHLATISDDRTKLFCERCGKSASEAEANRILWTVSGLRLENGSSCLVAEGEPVAKTKKYQEYNVELTNEFVDKIEGRRLTRQQIEAVFWYAEFVVHHGVPKITVEGITVEEED